MVVVGAGLRNHANVGPTSAAECCIVKSSLDLELFESVRIRGGNPTARRRRTQYVTYTDPVQLPVVVVGSRSMHENPVIGLSHLGKSCSPVPELSGVENSNDHSRRKPGNLSKVPGD
jgi:hypothetical protein